MRYSPSIFISTAADMAESLREQLSIIRIGSSYPAGCTSTAGSTTYALLDSIQADDNAVEANRNYTRIGIDATLKSLCCHVDSNGAGAASTFGLNAVGVSKGSLTIGAGQTGYFDVTGLSGSINKNDAISLYITTGAGGVIVFNSWSAVFESSGA